MTSINHKCSTKKCSAFAKKIVACAGNSPYGPYGTGNIKLVLIQGGKLVLAPATIGEDGVLRYENIVPPAPLFCQRFVIFGDFDRFPYTYDFNANFQLTGILYKDTNFQLVSPSLEFLYPGYAGPLTNFLTANGMTATGMSVTWGGGAGARVITIETPREIDQLYGFTMLGSEVSHVNIDRLIRAIPCDVSLDTFASRVTFSISETSPHINYIADVFVNQDLFVGGVINSNVVNICEANGLGTPQAIVSGQNISFALRPATPRVTSNPVMTIPGSTINGVVS